MSYTPRLFGIAVLLSGANALAQPSTQPPGGHAAPASSPPPSVYGASTVPQAFRDGFYIGFGGGVGGLQFTDEDGDEISEERETSATVNLRLGGAIAPQFLLGVNLGGWSKRYGESAFDNGVSLTLANVTLEATYYPVLSPSGVDLYVRGGLGGSKIAITDENTGDEVVGESGAAYNLGVGIEAHLSHRMALGFGINVAGGKFDGGGANYIDGALQLTWY